ncbi:MAG: heme lyase CcmF/NrfE family subunit [Deinococcales bacterium]
MSLFGEVVVLTAFIFCVYGAIIAWRAAHTLDARLELTARRTAGITWLFSTAGLVVLWVALLTNDTSVRFVANHSVSTSPLWVKIVSLWGALEGSILLWAWILACFTAILAWVAKPDLLRPYALAVMFFVLAFFLGVNASVGSPFIEVPIPPEDGRGPNALLQNHWMMAVHPVLMYIGFVGLSVPFAYAVAALLSGRVGEAWLVQTRRWTVTAWIFLSAAIITGGWWSYEVLGWGGYWAWDPVENASIIPWFFATAFLHSLQIQERRRILAGWNLGLIVAAFTSTLFGTFLTRSGIVQSVHAFAAGAIGPVFFGFLVLVLILVLRIGYTRLHLIRDDHQLDSPVSREGAFLFGNLLFSSYAAMVVIGTLFPVFMQAFTGAKSSVGAPFFNAVGVPLGLGILGLQAIGPALGWRRATGESLRQNLTVPAILALAMGIVGFVLGAREWSVVLTVVLGFLNIFVIVRLTDKAVSSRRKALGQSWFAAVGDLVNAFPRRYGAYIAHLGVVVISLGIAFSGAYKTEQEVSFRIGENKEVLGHNITYIRMVGDEKPERFIQAAEITLDGESFFPAQNQYKTQQMTVATPAVQYNFLGDFYVIFLSADERGQQVALKFINSPLVSWIWFGGLVMIIGAGLTLIPAVQVQVARQRTAKKTEQVTA